MQALRSVVPYLQGRPLHAVLFVERLDEYRVDSVDHQVGLQTDWGGGVEGADVCGNHAGRASNFRGAACQGHLQLPLMVPGGLWWASKAVL